MARPIRRLALLVTAGVVAATVVATPAVAAPTWRPVTNLFADLSAAGGSAFAPAIAVDDAGNATVVWSRSSRLDGTEYVVQASYRPVGGTWTAPVDLARGRQFVGPQVVVDPAGGAAVIWRRIDTESSVVQAASRTSSGAWSAPVDVSTDPSADYTVRDVPQIAVDAAGVVTATWSRFAKGQPWTYTAQSATRATDGTWSAPVDLSPAGSPAKSTDVTVDPAGTATAVWVAGASLQAATRPAGGAWTAPVQLSATAGPRANPRIVVDTSGTATAVWGSFAGGAYGVQTASRTAGGAWTAPLDLTSGEVFDTPAIAVDRQGNATALWQQHSGSGWTVTSASRAPGGAWSAPVSLSSPEHDAWDPQVSVDPAGNATAIWSRADGGRVIEAARRPVGGEWSESIDLSGRGEAWNPQIAIDPAGNATAAWSRKDGTSWIVQARGLDAAGPVVTDITGATSRISARGRATYSVKAFDAWSRVKSALWTFPDGTTKTGTSVSYAGDGSRAVRVVLTDSVGNATACSYTRTFTCRPTTRVAPMLIDAALDGRKIRAVGSDAKVAKKARATIELSTDARVTFTFRKAGSTPVRLANWLAAGRTVVAIRARLGAGTALAPGRWKVVVSAKNRFGSSTKERFRLRVVR